MKKKKEFSWFFGHNIISNDLYQAIRNNIVANNTTELVLLFHKKTTKLDFLWSNMAQKNFKVLRQLLDYNPTFSVKKFLERQQEYLALFFTNCQLLEI